MKRILFIYILLHIFAAALYAQAPEKVPDIAIAQGILEARVALQTDDFQLEGIASYYAEKFHQKVTANSEEYNMYDYTAAHRTLPFNSVVEVTNLENGKVVIVRINDRGPYLKNRVIDLSKQAAMSIGMIESGTAPVKLQVIRYGKKDIIKYVTSEGEARYETYQDVLVQVASYSQRNNAKRLIDVLATHNISGAIDFNGTLYRVVVREVSPEKINPLLIKLKSMGYKNPLVKHS